MQKRVKAENIKRVISEKGRKAGAELGQAQLKLGLNFTPTDLH